MSKFYRMDVEVRKYDTSKMEAIVDACNGEWEFNIEGPTDLIGDGSLRGTGESHLCSGESEEEFTQRLSKAVWKANGGFCEVYVRCCYLENIPCESYEYDEETFKEMTKESSE